MGTIAILLVVLAILLLVPSIVLSLQSVVAASKSIDRTIASSSARGQGRTCILMPAHNEASGLEAVIRALLPHLNARTRLLVVADNCTDNTAEIVRAIAAEQHPVDVVERHDPNLRGKGYALDFGVRHLRDDPPDVVLILDADCQVADDAIPILVAQCLDLQRPIQALYLMRNQPGAATKGRLAEFAWCVKNLVRPLGYYRLGMPCQLMGTGMAFTWAQISRARLNTGHIVEDMQLGLDLARENSAPCFCPQALVTSYFPLSSEGVQAQRTRWEHGHLGVIVSEVPSLLWQSLRRMNLPLLAMALDLCVPPLALLVLLLVAAVALCAGFWWFTGTGGLALQLTASSLALLTLSVLLAWARFGREIIGLKQLCSIPLYVVAKIPLYALFLIKRQASWVRSKRDGET